MTDAKRIKTHLMFSISALHSALCTQSKESQSHSCLLLQPAEADVI